MLILYGVLTGKDSQETSHYISCKSKSNIAFDTTVDVGVIPIPAFDKCFILGYPL